MSRPSPPGEGEGHSPTWSRKTNAGAGSLPPRRCNRRKTYGGVEAGDRLDFEIFFQAVFAPFAAVAGLLVAAERRGAVVGHALQVDVAGADPAADPAGAFDGVAGDVAGQTVRRVVGDLDRVLLSLAPRMVSTGPKISSRAMVMSLVTSAKMVGRT